LPPEQHHKIEKRKNTGISEVQTSDVQTHVINKWAKPIKLEMHMTIIEMW
jgi:hypothetical protein